MYLLSIDHAREHAELAKRLLAAGGQLVADNGNLDRIRALTKLFAERAAALPDDRATVMSFLDTMASEIDSVTDEALVRGVVAAQVSLAPTTLIGMEHLALPVAVQLGLGDAITPEQTVAWAARAIEWATRTQADAYGSVDAEVFAAVHATTFDEAVQIGANVGRAGLTSIATGVTFLLQDRRYASSWKRDGTFVSLARSVPAPYVRTAEVLAGLHVGFARVTGRRPRFHALGLGTPALLPLLAMLGSRRTLTACDSTAPIRDAWIEPTTSLYVDDPAPLKLKATKLAEHWMKGTPWRCTCPACVAFLDRYPARPELATARWLADGKPAVTPADLRGDTVYARAFPILATPDDPDVRAAAAMTRVAHNHHVVESIESAARAASASPASLREWACGRVEAYLASSAEPVWKAALGAAREIIEVAWRELEHVDDGWPPKGATMVSGPGREIFGTREALRRSREQRRRCAATLRPPTSFPALARRAAELSATLEQGWLIARPSALADVASHGVELGAAWAERGERMLVTPPPDAALAAARAVAAGLHASASLAHASGRGVRGGGGNPLRLADRLDHAERVYEARLAALHGAARECNADDVARVLATVCASTLEMRDLIVEAAALPWKLQVQETAPGLRASALARRIAMLAAAAVMLHQRIHENPSGTAQIAERRTTLRRRDVRPSASWRRVPRSLLGRRSVRIVGVIESAAFIERGDKPYGVATLVAGAGTLRLPHKNFLRVGAARGCIIAAVGLVKSDAALGLCLEVEQEGPTSHENAVWEDWLAVMARPAYDLYPNSLRAEWDFPDLRQHGARMDFVARGGTP